MERVTVQVLDDMHQLHDGTEVDAEARVILALDGEARQLDLTEAHAKELAEMLRPWLEAGIEAPKRKPGRQPATSLPTIPTAPAPAALPPADTPAIAPPDGGQTEAPPVVPVDGDQDAATAPDSSAPAAEEPPVTITEKRAYFDDMRAWAPKNGYGVTAKNNAGFYYSRLLRGDFAKHVLSAPAKWPAAHARIAATQT